MLGPTRKSDVQGFCTDAGRDEITRVTHRGGLGDGRQQRQAQVRLQLLGQPGAVARREPDGRRHWWRSHLGPALGQRRGSGRQNLGRQRFASQTLAEEGAHDVSAAAPTSQGRVIRLLRFAQRFAPHVTARNLSALLELRFASAPQNHATRRQLDCQSRKRTHHTRHVSQDRSEACKPSPAPCPTAPV